MLRTLGVLVVLLSTAIVGAAAYGLTKARTPTQTARAVLVTPTGGQSTLTGNPAASSQLAATYAQVLPDDADLIAAVSKATGDSKAATRRRIKVKRSSDASVMTLRVGADTAARARKGAQAAVKYLTSLTTTGDRVIQPRSITAVSTPRGSDGGSVATSRVRLLVSAPNSTTSDAQAASRLAANYAGLIPEDTAVLSAAGRRAGLDVGTLRNHIRVTNDPNTSLLRVSVTNSDYPTARRAVLGVVAAVIGDDPVSDTIAPSSLEVVRRPDREGSGTGGWAPTIAGALAGFLLGLATVIAYGRRHPRLRSAEKAREIFGIPVSDASEWTPYSARSLLTRWAEDGAHEVVLLPGSAKLDDGVVSLAASLDKHRRAVPGAPTVLARSYADAWDPRGDEPSHYAVAVTERGQRAGTIHTAMLRYESWGGRVRWVLLTRGGSSERLPTMPQTDHPAEPQERPQDVVA